MIGTSHECWVCHRPGQYWGDYALCDQCDTDDNRHEWELTAAAVYYERHKQGNDAIYGPIGDIGDNDEEGSASVSKDKPLLTVEQATELATIRGRMLKSRPLIDELLEPVDYADWQRVIDMLDSLLEPWDREH